MRQDANEQDQLLIEIARCRLVELNVCDQRSTHPCHEVVLHQWPETPNADARAARWRREHHVPEPWVGQIETAPLLFVSSNPSLASFRPAEPPKQFAPPLERIGNHTVRDHAAFRHGLAAPKPDWDDAEIIDRYENAFDVWTVGGTHAVANEAGEAGARISYWADVHPIAQELLGDSAVAGEDYALTEVTHCKSKGEAGARSSSRVCAQLYLERVLTLSPARLVVVFGRIARNAVRQVFDYPDPGRVSRPLRIAGRTRRLVFLTHPSAKRVPPEYPKRLQGEELTEVQHYLRRG
jgi:hypothetical protein